MNSELEARIQRRERIFLSILTGLYSNSSVRRTPTVIASDAFIEANLVAAKLDEADAKLRSSEPVTPSADQVDAQRYRKLEAAVKSLAIGDTLTIFDYAGEIQIIDGDDRTLSEGDTLGEAIDNLPMP